MMHFLIQVLVAFLGTVSFALLFGVPSRFFPFCGVTGSLGWALYLLLGYAGATAVQSVFIATVAVVLLSRFFSVYVQCPVTVFLIAGIFPLVPGGSVYWAAFYLVTNNTRQAFESGFRAVRLAVAIVLGIVIVFELPKDWFARRSRRKHDS